MNQLSQIKRQFVNSLGTSPYNPDNLEQVIRGYLSENEDTAPLASFLIDLKQRFNTALRLPDFKFERENFGRALAKANLGEQLNIFVPVCPGYSTENTSQRCLWRA